MAVAEQILNLQPLAETRPDRALVHDAQSGDPAAASALVERYYRRIYSFVSHLTYGRANAEDLTQEVFARALKALGRFNGRYQFEHWLLRIAKNLCIDEARRSAHSAEPTDPTELSELEGIPAPDYVWESVSRDMVASVVHRALMALPPRQRTILAMREMEDMSYADIAQVVGTNPRGVEATLRRARLRFRAEVARAEAIEEGQATCRRVLRLVTDDPEAPRSDEEAASHLARCASCRRATRTGAPAVRPVRAFGFLPLLGLGSLLKGHPATTPLRRAADRLREVAMAASLGTGAVALPLARMAEVTAGVVLATTVTLVPAVAALQPAATPVTMAAQAASPALPVAFVPVESVLFKASPSSPVVSTAPATASTAASTSSASTAPSVVTPQAPIPSLLGPLSADPGAFIATTLNNVASVSSILTQQLTQVAQLASATIAEVTNALPPALQPVVAPVTKATQQLTGTLGQTLNTVTKGVQQTADQVTTPLHP